MEEALAAESDDQLLSLFGDNVLVEQEGVPIPNGDMADIKRSPKQKLVLRLKGGCPATVMNSFYSGANSLVMVIQRHWRLADARAGLPTFDPQGKKIPRLNPGEKNNCVGWGPRSLLILSTSAPGKPFTDSVQRIEFWPAFNG